MFQRTDVDFVRAMAIGLAILVGGVWLPTNLTDDKPATKEVVERSTP